MHIRKKKNALSVMEAVDSLSLLAELDTRREKEKIEPAEFAEENTQERLDKHSWYNPRDFSYNLERIKKTFTVLFDYLRALYENEEEELKKIEMQKAIQAMMLLSLEAGGNLDKFLKSFPEGKSLEKVTEWEEYTQLQQFYLDNIAPKLQGKLEQSEKWQEEWGVGSEEEEAAKKRGIDDLESVRQDKEYELFFIRTEDGRAFFNRAIIRHIHLVEQFDSLLTQTLEEDPLAKIKEIKDRHLHLCAKEMIALAQVHIDEFYRMSKKHMDMPLVSLMHKAIIALMLAANPRNLSQTAIDKNCSDYFADFHLFFRALLSSQEYQRYIQRVPPLSERLTHCIINLSHVLCVGFFTHAKPKEEVCKLLRLFVEQGAEDDEISSPTHSPLSLWNVLLDEDEQIRNALKYSAYGPLHNAVVLFAKNKELKGFDPLFQGNIPYHCYSFIHKNHQIACVHLPCPTFQETIKKAVIVFEFHGFLRALGSGKRSQRHLLFNLQNRTSWQEHARCVALEELAASKEYEQALTVITLAIGTDFYLQSGPYFHLQEAKRFIAQFKEQLENEKQCGFYFPDEIKSKPFRAFIDKAMDVIHETFFAGKKTLAHKNRLDFIEIFYLFFQIKCIQEWMPHSISFTSKDGVDRGAASSAELFIFLKMLQTSKKITEEEKQTLRFLFYSPALMVRQRAIDCHSFKRSLSALSLINAELEAHYERTAAACSSLFSPEFLKGLKL